MKLLLISFFFVSSAMAQTLPEFLKMDDVEKVIFLDEKATLIEDSKSLLSYEKERPQMMKLLKKIGSELENVWGDTVLEGPYGQTGAAEVELTSIYQVNGKVFALGGRVSAPGIFLEDDSCQYDEEKDEWTDCSEVSIYEYFLMDVKGKFIESDRYPEVD